MSENQTVDNPNFAHHCEGSITSKGGMVIFKGVIPRQDEWLITSCFAIKSRPNELQVVLDNPYHPREDPLYEDVTECPFCGYKP